MAITVPRFTISNVELNTAHVITAGSTGDIFNLTGPGMIHSFSHAIDQTGTPESFTTEIKGELVVDGVTLFSDFLANLETIVVEIPGLNLLADVIVANDTFRFRAPQLATDRALNWAFTSSFIWRLRNTAGISAFNFTNTGLIAWHQGVIS